MLDQIDNHLNSTWQPFLGETPFKGHVSPGSRKRQRQDANLDARSDGTVMERKNSKVMKIEYKKGLWDKQEDVKLLELVKQQQTESDPTDPSKVKKLNWTIVSKGMKTRSCKQCRERWVNHLNPGVRKTKWTAEEDKLLLELARENPRKWAQIARQMPGRTENMVKIRWNSLNKQANNSRGARTAERRSSVKISKPIVHKETAQSFDHSNAKHDSLPFIRSSIADYCGHSPEYMKAEPFIEDVFLDDYVLDSFMFESAPYVSNRGNNGLAFDNLVPINL